MMQLIEQEPHFWELYQQDQQYFLGIAVDMSSVVTCWDLVLNAAEIQAYQDQGRRSIENIAKHITAAAYKGDFSDLESRQASVTDKQAMQATYRAWRQSQY